MTNHANYDDRDRDPETGYLIPVNKQEISPLTKKGFIDYLKDAIDVNPLVFPVRDACKALGIDKSTVYKHIKRDIVFGRDFNELREQVLDAHEENVARHGTKSFIASIAFLKAMGRDRWRDKSTVEHKSDSEKNIKDVLERAKNDGFLIDVPNDPAA